MLLCLENHPAPASGRPELKSKFGSLMTDRDLNLGATNRFIPRNEVYLIKNSLGEKFTLTLLRLPSIPFQSPLFPAEKRNTIENHIPTTRTIPGKIPKKNPECHCQSRAGKFSTFALARHFTSERSSERVGKELGGCKFKPAGKVAGGGGGGCRHICLFQYGYRSATSLFSVRKTNGTKRNNGTG